MFFNQMASHSYCRLRYCGNKEGRGILFLCLCFVPVGLINRLLLCF